MEIAQIVSIFGIILGFLMMIGGYYLILLDSIQKKKAVSSEELKAIPEIIKALAELIGKPGGLGLVIFLAGFALDVYCISWWLNPGLIPKILTSNSSH